MATATSRQTHIDWCLRSLGDPVIEINVDDDQLEDRVDESLEYFREYHSETRLSKTSSYCRRYIK